MATFTRAARKCLTKVLQENEELLSSSCKSDPMLLAKKMMQKSILSDCRKYNFFKSLDHSRVDPQLQIRYLLRLVSERVNEDESVWEKLLRLLKNMGEKQMYDHFIELASVSHTETWCDCPSELTSDSDSEIWYDCLSEFTCDTKEYHTLSTGPCLEKTLSSKDIPWILEVLVKVSYSWELLARALGLPRHEIEECRKSNNKLSLDNILCCLLAKDSISMNTLVTALRSKLVGECRVAQELEDKCKHIILSSFRAKSESSDSSFSIIDQSYDIEVADGKSTLLQVQASPRESVHYMWKKDGQPLANSCTYYGVNEDILVISYADQGTEGDYACCVSYRESEKCSNKITLTVLYPPAKKQLLDLYSIHREVPPDSWPPVGTKSFINLTVVKSKTDFLDNEDFVIDENAVEVMDRKVKVDYCELFGQYSSRTLIVIEGRPGSGKTTLIYKVVKDWSKGAALQKAKYVFLITLRVVNGNTTQETLFSILSSLYHREEELRKVCDEVEAANGEGVCFIIDGLDEYHPIDKNKSLIYKLLNKTFLPLAMIIVTSRPIAIQYIREEAVMHKVEVLGFSKQQILKYIDSFPFVSTSFDAQYTASYPAKLKLYLHSHPNVFNMCYLPIHAAMICFIFECKNEDALNTQTKIYQEFTRATILRHLRRHNTEAQVSSLKTLEGNINKHFNKLCQLAYSMTINRKQVAGVEFMDDELCEYIHHNSDEWCLGLVTINQITELSGISKMYSFLHLTVQEFLTAYYITNIKQGIQIQVFSQFHGIYTFSPVVLFYFGLIQFRNRKDLGNLLDIHDELDSLCHCALESQQQIVCDEVAMYFEGRYITLFPTPSDLYAMSYVILHTSYPVTEIRLMVDNDVDCTDFLQNISKRKFSFLQRLALNDKLNNAASLALSNLLKSCSNLKYAELLFHEISYDSAKAISDQLKYLTNLNDLSITCYSNSGGIGTLLRGLTSLQNTQLRIMLHDMDSSALLKIGRNIQFLANAFLQLTLKDCIINEDAAAALANGLNSNIHIQELNITNNVISNADISALFKKMHNFTKLSRLDLSCNNLTCNGADALAPQLQYLIHLRVLELSHNNIGPRGAMSLAEMLHHLTELENFSLSHNNIDLNSVRAVIIELKHSPNLFNIYLHSDDKRFQLHTNIHFGRSIHVEGLVSQEDDTAITDLIAAAQHPTICGNLHLGFKIVSVSPLISSKNNVDSDSAHHSQTPPITATDFTLPPLTPPITARYPLHFSN